MKRKLFGLLIAFLFITLILSGCNENNKKKDWWNSNWNFRKKIEIKNNIDDYQMKLVVGKNSQGDINCNGNSQDDFDDIRFVSCSVGKELPYWIENYSVDDHATFWINNVYNDSNIWMYYGNVDAITTSDGFSTWDYFENFESYLDNEVVSGWTSDSEELTLKANNSEKYEGAVGGKFINNDYGKHHDIGLNLPIIDSFKFFVRTKYGNNDNYHLCIYNSSSNLTGKVARAGYYWMFNDWAYWDANGKNEVYGNINYSKWHNMILCMNKTHYKLTCDEVNITPGFVSKVDTNPPIKFGFLVGKGDIHYVDLIRIGKYSANPPCFSYFGSEEINQ
ncbi:MAG: DUF2341 domain-containing protein [Candidatus Thermoplasmatota archaeon]